MATATVEAFEDAYKIAHLCKQKVETVDTFLSIDEHEENRVTEPVAGPSGLSHPSEVLNTSSRLAAKIYCMLSHVSLQPLRDSFCAESRPQNRSDIIYDHTHLGLGVGD